MKKRYVPTLLLLLCLIVIPAQAQNNGFGGALAIGDDVVFISETQNTLTAGSVFVFERDDASGDWVQNATLSASDATDWDDRFGRALTTDGQTLIVGATKNDGTKGASYIFERDGSGHWTETARLVASDAADDYHFGRVLAISGDVALITSLGHSESAGAVYVFQRDASGVWSERAILKAGDAQPGDYFGMSLALDGHTAFIGAPPQNEATGGVYIFEYDAASDTWSETGKLEMEGLEEGDQFGGALALRDGVALVGAPRIDGNLGAVFVFERDAESGEWNQQAKLVPFDGEIGRLGSSLAFDGEHAWIGSPGASGFQGAVYLYRRDAATGAWVDATKLTGQEVEGGDFFSGALAMKGHVAVVGALGADYGAGTATIFEQAGSGEWMEKNTVFNDVGGLASIVGEKVNCTNGEADQFGCSQVDLLSFLSVRDIGGGRGVRTNDLWGWTDPETGKEYALVGRIDAAAFVDISDPNNPVYLGELPRTEGSPGSTWRDIKVYNDHAFIVADGAGDHGMQVFDLRQLRDVENPPVVFEETAHYDGIASAHNIVINEETGYAFSVGSSGGGETCGGGLHMIDIRQPAEPTFAGCFSDTETGRQGTGYSHDAQCVIYQGPDVEHQGKEICFGANETALSIADVTDKANPVAISNASYPNVGYSHQGWLTEDHRYFYMNDELDELQGKVDGTRTLVWDVMDLDDPQLIKEHYSENKASDHNLYIRGNLMYQSNYQSGLRILDISDAANPVEVGFFDTVPYGEDAPSFGGSWSNYPFFQSGVIVVTSGYEGMFILKKKDIDI